jgi:hypothetical protein
LPGSQDLEAGLLPVSATPAELSLSNFADSNFITFWRKAQKLVLTVACLTLHLPLWQT